MEYVRYYTHFSSNFILKFIIDLYKSIGDRSNDFSMPNEHGSVAYHNPQFVKRRTSKPIMSSYGTQRNVNRSKTSKIQRRTGINMKFYKSAGSSFHYLPVHNKFQEMFEINRVSELNSYYPGSTKMQQAIKV